MNMTLRGRPLSVIGFAVVILLGVVADAADWPMWRFDAGHTAASFDDLPNELRLEWTRQYSPRKQVWDDPLNHDLMPYDRLFEPVVKDGRMYVGFNDADKVVAIDVASGREQWTFFTEGPVRFPAVAWQDVVLFCSDDGHLYCVDATSGELRWKFRGGPTARKAVGNERLISIWPARGGPVVTDDKVYFAASIWPFMGTFIYCLDAATGDVVWANDHTSWNYVKQPHSAPSFAGIAPQGTMTVSGDYLLIPGGRSVPAAFDRHTGKQLHFRFNEGGKGNGGSLVLAFGDEFFVHTRQRGVRAYDLVSGEKTAFTTNEPVLGETVFAYEQKQLDDKEQSDNSDTASTPVSEIPVLRAYNAAKEVVWELEGVDGSGDIIRAGNRLYAAGEKTLTAVDLPEDGSAASVAWSMPVQYDIQRLLAASGKLLGVTLDGRILCYGDGQLTGGNYTQELLQRPEREASNTVADMIRRARTRQGYVLFFGNASSQLIDEVISNSDFHLVVVDDDADRIQAIRETYDSSGLYGHRLTAFTATIDTIQAPPYLAKLVIVGREMASQISDTETLRTLYESVRPYGGCLVMISDNEDEASSYAGLLEDAKLEKSLVGVNQRFAVARRVGPLPGAADWTHQYGNVANTVKSDDSRVRAPLGLLWFGGSSNMDVLPRHGHGPPEQVTGGRLFIEGMNSLSCRDVYTGQVIWKRDFNDLGTYDIYFDETYKDTPLDPAYNQVHIPGANGRGTNFVATEDAVYILEGEVCHVLDVETGETLRKLTMPDEVQEKNRTWGYLGVYKDILLGGAGFAEYRRRLNISFDDEDSKLRIYAKGYGSKSFDTAASVSLVAFNRHTGKVMWKSDARHSYIHNGVVAGDDHVYCLDKLPQQIEDKLKRRGQAAPDSYRIVCLDVRTGEELWQQEEKIFGTWLGYSEQRQLLLLAGADASDRMKSEVGQGMAVYDGATGSLTWRVEDRDYSGPCIIHNDMILTNANSYRLSAGAFNLLDGTPKLIVNPITKEEQPWQLCRTYGCNNIIASENLLTFRSGAAGFYDLKTLSGTGNLGGFKSGCTSNLVVANGVLNAPDYTRTCSCAYQNQTSLALIHMPELDMWAVNHTASLSTEGKAVARMGINFGAPGDRMDDSGTFWFDHPKVGGDSVKIDIKTNEDANYFHRNSFGFSGPGLPWVGASGAVNVRRIAIPSVLSRESEELRFRIQRDNDDAVERSDGSIDLTGDRLSIVPGDEPQTVGLRFDNVQIKPGRKIESAHIQFATASERRDTTRVRFSVEDSGDAAVFTEQINDISQRLFIDEVSWEVPQWEKLGRAEESERTPDLAKLIQQVVDRTDWRSGHAICVAITGSGDRSARSYDGDAKLAPELVVRLAPEASRIAEHPHTVRLFFAEPKDVQPGERVFDVALQGATVATDVDVVAEAGGPQRTMVREFRDILIGQELILEFEPKVGEPLINGVEIMRQ